MTTLAKHTLIFTFIFRERNICQCLGGEDLLVHPFPILNHLTCLSPKLERASVASGESILLAASSKPFSKTSRKSCSLFAPQSGAHKITHPIPSNPTQPNPSTYSSEALLPLYIRDGESFKNSDSGMQQD